MSPVPGLGPDSLLGRWVARVGRSGLTPRGFRIATFSVALGLGLALVAMLFAMHVSSTPRFCGTCHIMKPYYESWQTSKHNRIACVDCHISPGITAELRKKYEALSMIAKYVTGTYGSNPWAEVDDAACLRCHERRLLEGREVFHSVLFDHRPHLAETRRGLKLRCTSCHSQIVQGSHISVTTSTCALCHFRGQKSNEGLGRCLLCHQVPERVTSSEGVSFDHAQVARLDMQCSLCHAGVVRGEGNVPRERCMTCHNQPDRLARSDDREFLHQTHVADHKVDCMNCHLQIEHGKPPATKAAEAAGACESCHGSGHSPQQDLYAGIGGRGVPRMPSPMFTAGVTCQGCHNPDLASPVLLASHEGATIPSRAGLAPPASRPASTPPVPPTAATSEISGPHSVRAGAVSCMSCHGPAYDRIYRGWKEGVGMRLAALRRQLEATVGAMGLSPPQAWLDARHNFELVEQGKGVHNVNYAYALFEKAHEQMNAARRAKRLGALERPWVVVGAGSGKCLSCHQGIERQAGTFHGRAFSHRPHLAARLECATCHRPHEERAPGEVTRFGRDGCLSCHHRTAEVEAPACAKCHGDVTARTVTSARGEFSHKLHLGMGLACATCHQPRDGDPRPKKADCAQCHSDD